MSSMATAITRQLDWLFNSSFKLTADETSRLPLQKASNKEAREGRQWQHYNDVIMSEMAFQIAGVSIV